MSPENAGNILTYCVNLSLSTEPIFTVLIVAAAAIAGCASTTTVNNPPPATVVVNNPPDIVVNPTVIVRGNGT